LLLRMPSSNKAGKENILGIPMVDCLQSMHHNKGMDLPYCVTQNK